MHKAAKGSQLSLLQKLDAALSAKGLSGETSISASDEADYGVALATFVQYGDALDAIDQLNTHSYPGMTACLCAVAYSRVSQPSVDDKPPVAAELGQSCCFDGTFAW